MSRSGLYLWRLGHGKGGNDFKYETPSICPYIIVQTWKNGNVTIQMGAVTDRLNIRRIKPDKIPEVDLIRSSTEFLSINISSKYKIGTNKYVSNI